MNIVWLLILGKVESPPASSSEEIWKLLREKALSDGIITLEEEKLISNIVLDVEAYNQMVHEAREDGKITENEKTELFEGRIEILEKAYAIAREDQNISDDEVEILKSIVKLVLDMEKKR